MAESGTIRAHERIARAAVSVGALSSVAFWLWRRGAPSTEVGTNAAVGLTATLLVIVGRGWVSTVGKVALGLLVGWHIVAAYARDGGVPIDASRLEAVPHGRELFVAISLVSSCCAGFSLLGELASGLESLFRGLARHAREVAYAGVVVVAVTVSADVYFAGRGSRFSLEATRMLPYHGPGSGSYAVSNVLEAEFTDNRGGRFRQRKPDGVQRIVLEGASTMWGHQLADEDAPAEVLRRALAARFPETRFEVIQMALKGKYLMDEMFDAVSVLPRWRPDLVISLNGFNDVADHDSDGFEGLPFWMSQIDAALGTPPLSQLLYESTHVGPVVFQRAMSKNAGAASRLSRPDLYTPPRYYTHLEVTARNLRAAGIPYAFSFTPNINDLGRGTPWFNANYRYRRRVSGEIVAATGQMPFNAIAPFVDQPIETVFMDNVHFTALGVKVLVASLVDQIPGWLGLGGAPAHTSTPLPSIQQALSMVPYIDAKANSPALTAPVGVRVTSAQTPELAIRTTGVAGLLQAGPSIDLDPGLYAVEWYGSVDQLDETAVDVVAKAEGGRLETVAQKPVNGVPLPAGKLADLVFSLRSKARGVEYRFHVSADTQLELERVVLIQLSPDPAGHPPEEWREYAP